MEGSQGQTVEEQVEDAKLYLERHHIPELFDLLVTSVLYNRPANPRKYLADQLKLLITQGNRGDKNMTITIFNKDNINALYRFFDPTDKGYMSYAQYIQGMKYLGIKDYAAAPKGMRGDQVPKTTFVTEGLFGLGRIY